MWRQGDVFIERVATIPDAARTSPLPHGILVHGEVTGHSHRLRDARSGKLFSGPPNLFLEVGATGAVIVHEEHGDVALGTGVYRVWRQREYTPQAIVTVVD
jgi:hypothetical protein